LVQAFLSSCLIVNIFKTLPQFTLFVAAVIVAAFLFYPVDLDEHRARGNPKSAQMHLCSWTRHYMTQMPGNLTLFGFCAQLFFNAGRAKKEIQEQELYSNSISRKILHGWVNCALD